MSIPSSKELSTFFCVSSLAEGKGDPNFARLQKEGAEGRLFQGGNHSSVHSAPTPASARQLPGLSEERPPPTAGCFLSLQAGLFIPGHCAYQ